MQNRSGFVYLWRDRKHKRYYVGCHWGFEDDGYICSSTWMRNSLKRRPEDFKRRILKRNIECRTQLFEEELRYLQMIKATEIKTRYYNLHITNNGHWLSDPNRVKTIGEKISAAKMGKSPKWVDPELRGQRIAEGKKKAFEKRLAETGSKLSPEHHAKVGLHNIGKKHTDEWKAAAGARMKQQWDD